MVISGAYDLRAILGDMGIADLLDKEADFSGITREAPLKLSKVSVPRVPLIFRKKIHSTNNNKEHGAPS